jgi:AcrR family transcriptional regulator
MGAAKVCDDKLASFDVLGSSYLLPFSNIGSKTKEHILIESTVLFALKGYSAVSMRDIAEKVGITAAALYNHFASKEDLWDAVLNHIVHLYYLYHNHLDEALAGAETLGDVLDVLFAEPKLMRNMFTCYGFGLLMKEHLSDAKAGALFREVMVEYGTSFIKKWLERSVEAGMARPFDVDIVAKVITNNVLIAINLKLQESVAPGLNYNIAATFDGLKIMIMTFAGLTGQ